METLREHVLNSLEPSALNLLPPGQRAVSKRQFHGAAAAGDPGKSQMIPNQTPGKAPNLSNPIIILADIYQNDLDAVSGDLIVSAGHELTIQGSFKITTLLEGDHPDTLGRVKCVGF